ncbi:NRAMP family divalent metal transporter [Tellurirhabdus bombi]|uniref:NRAMP family divalent metal transporter n=1 Tax=Tellurirhabdus bombi TaxID=2907205 RepID=UPI001F240E61|nr:divalent metal cation transporter [Tellurirhabdus bombi]
MPKSITLRSGLSSVLFWSIISAAFIGPGSVTTCAIAGSKYGLDLLWSLTFATLGTIWLQEPAARITIASGLHLGEVITRMFATRSRLVLPILFGAVTLGCAAYQAGNILGAVAGLSLLTGWSTTWLTVAVGLACVALLWGGTTSQLANFLGIIVLAMGVAFVYVAVDAPVSPVDVSVALVKPLFPVGSLVLINGLIGTTIVPYNLFLGSGIGQGQSLTEMRLGIWLAVIIGGIISVALLLSGLLIVGDFSYEKMAAVLSGRVGPWGKGLFAFGLFAAGFASSLTAPLAASVTARSLLGWKTNSVAYRAVWLSVLATGMLFGLAEAEPIPVIVAVQAINGVLLPFVTVFLFLAVNNRSLLPEKYCNSVLQNLAMISIIGATTFLGLRNVMLVLLTTVSGQKGSIYWEVYVPMIVTLLIVGWLVARLVRVR